MRFECARTTYWGGDPGVKAVTWSRLLAGFSRECSWSDTRSDVWCVVCVRACIHPQHRPVHLTTIPPSALHCKQPSHTSRFPDHHNHYPPSQHQGMYVHANHAKQQRCSFAFRCNNPQRCARNSRHTEQHTTKMARVEITCHSLHTRCHT